MFDRKPLREGWLTLILSFVMLLIVSGVVNAAGWTDDLDLLNWVVLLAGIVGVIFAKSRLPGWVLHPVATLFGIMWVGVLGFRFVPYGNGWEDKIILLIERILRWIDIVVQGGRGADAAIFVLQMGILLWFIAYGAVWHLFRNRSIWGVLVPTGATVLINTYYAQTDLTRYLIAYLLIAFLLVVRIHLLEREDEWQQARVSYDPGLLFDFLREGIVFAVVVLVISWTLPSAVQEVSMNPTLARISRPWAELQRTWSRLFTSLNYRSAGTSGWFGTNMSFRGPLNLSDRLVMYVDAPAGRYWRASVFDEYTSAGWRATDTRLIQLDGEQARIPLREAGLGRRVINATFEIVEPAGTVLFTPAQPVQISIPANVVAAGPVSERVTSDVDSLPETAVAQVHAKDSLIVGDTYRVHAAIPDIDEQSLRNAGTEYPAYIEQHYTRVPATVPQVVHDLAREVTQNADTPYDKAKAIEQYVRNIEYDETIPGPRPGEDGVYYFLFEEQAGYCDYYASSMAVMLRSLGIPTRIAQGYSLGEFTQEQRRYEVRGVDAHTWVEVFFPRYGWIEFEPTAAEPILDRPDTPEEENAGAADDTSQDEQQDSQSQDERLEDLLQEDTPPELNLRSRTARFVQGTLRQAAVPLGILTVFGLAAGGVTWALRRRWRNLPIIEKAYDQLLLVTRILGLKPHETQTPREYITQVTERIPTTKSSLERLAELVNKARFAAHAFTQEDESRADSSWREARRRLFEWVLRRRRDDEG